MLQELSVKNFGIIDELKIDFSKGLHIFTGETGAGKSMIIDALNLIIGDRASAEQIRHDQDCAIIEALFEIPNKYILELQQQTELEFEDNALIITREIKAKGKSTCRINGRLMPVSMAKDLLKPLIDIHGQHEHQKLLYVNEHIKMLDNYGKKELGESLTEVKTAYNEYKTINEKYIRISSQESNLAQRQDFLFYQLEEIKLLSLTEGEEESLEERKKILDSQEKILINTQLILDSLQGNDKYESFCATDHIQKAINSMHELVKIDSKYNEMLDLLENANLYLQEVIYGINKNFEIDNIEQELNVIEARLFELQQAKRKFKKEITEIIKYKNTIEIEIEEIKNRDSILEELKESLERASANWQDKADKLSKKRKKVAKTIADALILELQELCLAGVKLEVKFEINKNITANGYDLVEFMFSANPGEPVKPLAKIASGGELSRLMLAFKSLLSNVDQTPTVIFDEVDTGVSGQAALKIAEKLNKIAKGCQVLCVTHMPQIAAYSDVHFLIKKKVNSGGKTATEIKQLNEEEIIVEISRMIAGDEVSDKTKEHAQETRKRALATK